MKVTASQMPSMPGGTATPASDGQGALRIAEIIRATQDHAFSSPRELEMGYVRRRDGSHELESVEVIADAIEQPLTASK